MMSNFDTAGQARQLALAGLPIPQAHAQALAKVFDKLAHEAQLLTLQYDVQTASRPRTGD
ncbi:hypothetical protein HF313_31115 [Massilia atriviolacea]|uniref:Uncharacterized protein n=1 Tax=Massilia atriviolacea TaxID=2495579 RepID=A0A430HPM9_9BURK|nr:hypothetical protein [Massilia atriviolacea]RSZ59463.1 hypothetical protein EJB06_09940 [Massilia atriviolacea]